MTPVTSGLADPPADLAGFPRVASMPAQLHRLSLHPGVWWFSTSNPEAPGGRFDLPMPDGACYLAERLDGALAERLLRTPARIVVREQLHALFHATVVVRTSPDPTADLTHRTATRFGVNAEIHSTLDYTRTQRWAAALRQAGFKALRYLLRSDPAADLVGYALFGRAGEHRRAPAGMRTRIAPLDVAAATASLDDLGIDVLSLRATPPVIPPPR